MALLSFCRRENPKWTLYFHGHVDFTIPRIRAHISLILLCFGNIRIYEHEGYVFGRLTLWCFGVQYSIHKCVNIHTHPRAHTDTRTHLSHFAWKINLVMLIRTVFYYLRLNYLKYTSKNGAMASLRRGEGVTKRVSITNISLKYEYLAACKIFCRSLSYVTSSPSSSRMLINM